MEFIEHLNIAVLSALQCKKGHKNIIKHKLTYNPTVHILKRKEKKQTNKKQKKQNKIKNKNKNKYGIQRRTFMRRTFIRNHPPIGGFS